MIPKFEDYWMIVGVKKHRKRTRHPLLHTQGRQTENSIVALASSVHACHMGVGCKSSAP
jgi:hypothetical protein